MLLATFMRMPQHLLREVDVAATIQEINDLFGPGDEDIEREDLAAQRAHCAAPAERTPLQGAALPIS